MTLGGPSPDMSPLRETAVSRPKNYIILLTVRRIHCHSELHNSLDTQEHPLSWKTTSFSWHSGASRITLFSWHSGYCPSELHHSFDTQEHPCHSELHHSLDNQQHPLSATQNYIILLTLRSIPCHSELHHSLDTQEHPLSLRITSISWHSGSSAVKQNYISSLLFSGISLKTKSSFWQPSPPSPPTPTHVFL